MTAKSLGEQNYEQFADRYAARVETKAHNAHIVDPAVSALLPPLAGLRVLDAGCGSGWYSERFLNAGAQVTPIDVTPAFVEIAQQRLGDRATVRRQDLTQPLAFAADGTFDLVFANLVLDYLEDWTPTLREFARVLVPGGRLIFACGNPVEDWLLVVSGRFRLDELPDYFTTQMYAFPWGGFGEPRPVVREYRRPISALFNPLIDAGFALEQVIEPQPTEAFREADPDDYERHKRSPTFIAIRARRT